MVVPSYADFWACFLPGIFEWPGLYWKLICDCWDMLISCTLSVICVMRNWPLFGYGLFKAWKTLLQSEKIVIGCFVITHPPIIRCWPTGRPVGQQIVVLGQRVNLLAYGLDLVNRSTGQFSRPIYQEQKLLTYPPRTFHARTKTPSIFLSIIFVTNHIYVTAAT